MKKYDVAAYIWPAYTGEEARTRMFWPDGIGEWQTVQSAIKKFPEHNWPRKPLWGYVDEADPLVMEMQIDAATDYGVNVFIYDWYWYDGRPFLENCLNNGFLKARNVDKMQFYVMWANHDANHLWDKRLSDIIGDTVIWSGAVTRSQFEEIAHRLIDQYFFHPSYYKINNCPVLMIYDVQNLINGLGGIDNTRSALDWLHEETRKAGFADLHVQFAMYGDQTYNVSGVDRLEKIDASEIINKLAFDSMTNYQFCHLADMNQDYMKIIEDVKDQWQKIEKKYAIPFFPHISVGWDNNPRFNELLNCITKNNTPENFKKALLEAKHYVDTHELPVPLITINSWNEWTETSYLEPDDLYGYGYLQAIKDVFKA